MLPDLIHALGSHDANIRFLSSQMLAELGPAAVSAIPALILSIGMPDATKPWANPGVAAASAFGGSRALQWRKSR